MKKTKRMRGLGMLIVGLFLGAVNNMPAGTFDSWSHRMTITLPGYAHTGTLTNFPVLLVLSNNVGGSGFSYDGFDSPTGNDLRFAASNETDELNYEIESWDTNGVSHIYVQIPEIKDTNTLIYGYWGHAEASAPAYSTNGAVWSDGYVGVWHLSETNILAGQTDGIHYDSTSNRINGTQLYNVPGDGVYGGGQYFDGSSAYIDFGNPALLQFGGDLTLSVWVNPEVLSGERGLLSKWGSSWCWVLQNGVQQLWFDGWRAANMALSVGSWSYVAAVYDSGASQIRLYVNGKLRGTHGQGVGPGSGANLRLAHRGDGISYLFQGRMDEARLSSVVRSGDWLETVWLNQASNDVFLTYSDAGQIATNLAVVAYPATAVGVTNAMLGGKILHTGEAENPGVFVCIDSSDQGTGGTSAWARVLLLGADWGSGQSFSTTLTDLLSGSNYAYRYYVTNSTGEAWSEDVVVFQTIYLATVANPGAVNVSAGTAELRAEVTDTGNDEPRAWFEYWPTGGSVTSTVAMGSQIGLFATTATGLEPSTGYEYRAVVSNQAGYAYSGIESFNTLGGLYVAQSGDNSTGADWTTAYQDLQTAVDAAGAGAVIYVKAETFSRTSQIDLSDKVNLIIRGGYEGTGPEPGPLAAGPSKFSRASGTTRLFYGNATTVTLERVWIQGGYLTVDDAKGSGMYFSGGSSVSLYSCTLTNNYSLAAGYTCQGGGLYINGGTLTVSNTLFQGNSVQKASWNTGSFGGAIYAAGTEVTLIDSQFVQNHVWTRHQPNHGGAIYLTGGQATLTGCVFSNNYTRSEGNGDAGPTRGGAMHAEGVASLLIEDCFFTANRLWITSGNIRQGGALYLGGSAGNTVLRRSVFFLNGDGAEEQGDIAITAGTLTMSNVLVARSAGGSGLFSNGGTVLVDHCTFANNVLHGVNRMAGDLSIRNSIAWGNNSSGFYNIDDVTFSCSQEVIPGTGNISTDPLFVDDTYFHIKALAGAYSGGYFSGGVWIQSDADSPCLDTAAPTGAYDQEPHPNGFRANMGAYGNSPTASKTYLQDPGVFTTLTAFAHPVDPLSPTSVRLRGQVLSTGGAENPHAYLCWGTADGGTGSTGVWEQVMAMGIRDEWELFTHDLTDLEGNWFYRAYITNSTGSAWSSPVAFSAPSPATVTNLGPYRIRRTVAELRGQVLEDGGNTATLWFWHWQDGSAVTSITAVGQFSAPLVFTTLQSDLEPDTQYHYRILASNDIGLSWSDTVTYTTLSTNPIARYVTVEGAGIFDGTSWNDAYVGLVNAMEDCTHPGDTIYVKSGMYIRSAPINLNGKTGLTISGGYAGDGQPGSLSGQPTIFTRDSNFNIRIMQGIAATATVERVLIQGGYLSTANSQGAGIHISGGSHLTLIDCTLANNYILAGGNACFGGAVYASASTLLASNSTFTANSVRRLDWSTGSYGGAIYATDSEITLADSIFSDNYVWTRHQPCYGGAVYLTGGSLDVRNSVFTGNYTQQEGNSDGPGPARGGAIHANAPTAFSIVDSFFQNNRCYTPNSATSLREGGAVYVSGATGTKLMTRSVFKNNGVGADEKGDIFLASGTMSMTNVLVAGSSGGSGIHVNTGALDIELCTLADNVLYGIFNASGTVNIRNSIAWGNTAGGITNAVVNYTLAQEDHAGVGNFVDDPLFADTVYYHLETQQEYLAGGYFTGGVWTVGLVNSPAIDAGDPDSPFELETIPNGRRINLGAYGNTAAASRTKVYRGTMIRVR